MRHLAERGIPVPAPVANVRGELVTALQGKPAAIVSKLDGSSHMDPQPVHCREVGTMLARMHLAALDFPLVQPNLRGLDWWQATAPRVLPHLAPETAGLLQDEIAFQTDFAAGACYARLARGPVHADLFRNTWLFDLAVTVNDWCIDLASGTLDAGRAGALLGAYSAVRPFTDDEMRAWQPMLRAAALRFWLSRLYDLHVPRAAEMLTPHDPTHFERILRDRIANPAPGLANHE
jgi:homoserine kinase type II